jgi:hypothetical protein
MAHELLVSCRKQRDKLGTLEPGGRRMREHTELLIDSMDPGVLWDEYGIVSDVVVR